MDSLKETITSFYDLFENILEETLEQSDFSDLTHQQLEYLKVLVKMDNPTPSELAKELDLTKPTVTVLVNKLAEKGYIKRVHSDDDRRVMHLFLDSKGEKINALRELAHERLTEITRSGLNYTETVILRELLKKVVSLSALNQE
jgi:MarR family transcriptional regulator, transcriptional regulator for hemolysin